jgi:hypothetical protein
MMNHHLLLHTVTGWLTIAAFLLLQHYGASGFVIKLHNVSIRSNARMTIVASANAVDESQSRDESTVAEIDKLIDMDVVVYSFIDDPAETKRLAALQEDGVLSPLSAWTTEPAFGESVEFLVDEEDRFTLVDKMERIKLHHLVDESNLSYGSRQCHRGVGNPHGEESELLYYIDQGLIERFDAKFDVKPELEILW